MFTKLCDTVESAIITGLKFQKKSHPCPFYPLSLYLMDSQGFKYGYDFAVEADPSVKMQVEMDIMAESPVCGLSNSASFVPESSSLHYVQLCRDEYPKGNVRVTIRELSILVEDVWKTTWTP